MTKYGKAGKKKPLTLIDVEGKKNPNKMGQSCILKVVEAVWEFVFEIVSGYSVHSCSFLVSFTIPIADACGGRKGDLRGCHFNHCGGYEPHFVWAVNLGDISSRSRISDLEKISVPNLGVKKEKKKEVGEEEWLKLIDQELVMIGWSGLEMEERLEGLEALPHSYIKRPHHTRARRVGF
ncbi:hypothetical protein Tco_0065534 [Tanacetum coccineum]